MISLDWCPGAFTGLFFGFFFPTLTPLWPWSCVSVWTLNFDVFTMIACTSCRYLWHKISCERVIMLLMLQWSCVSCSQMSWSCYVTLTSFLFCANVFSLLLQLSSELQLRAARCPGFLHTAVLSYMQLLQVYLDGLELKAAGQLSNNQVTQISGAFYNRRFFFFLTQCLKCIVRWSPFRSWARPSSFFCVWFHRHLQLLCPPANSHR